MSDMRHLLEKMNTFAGERVGQKPGDQVRGSEPMPKKGGGKKHPYAGRLVGASESSDNLLKELTQVINSDPVKRDLFQEWAEYKEGFDDTVKSAADKIVAAGSATRDALGSVVSTIPSIPRPFDEKEVAKDLSKVQSTQPKTSWRNTDKKMQEDDVVAEWGAAGTAVGPGNDDADPVEIAAQRAQQVAGKQDQQNQVAGLIAQVNGARSELAGLNKQFPQGANPVEKAMSLQQMQGQRVALGRQIEDLMSQVASLRSQA